MANPTPVATRLVNIANDSLFPMKRLTPLQSNCAAHALDNAGVREALEILHKSRWSGSYREKHAGIVATIYALTGTREVTDAIDS